jgi:hypothetical protein
MNEKEEFSEALYLRVKSSPSSWAAREIQRLRDEVARLEKELDDSIQETNRMHAGPPHINDYDVKGQ